MDRRPEQRNRARYRYDGDRGMLAETFIGRFFVPAIFYVVRNSQALRTESIATHARRGAQFGDEYEKTALLGILSVWFVEAAGS